MTDLNTLITSVMDLGEDLTIEALNDAVRQLDAAPPEGSTATFSSGGDPINTSSGQTASNFVSDLSLDSVDASGGARISHIADTEVGQFLQDPQVKGAIKNAGLENAVNAATPDSPWGIASKRYAENVSGDVVAVVPVADPDPDARNVMWQHGETVGHVC